LRYFVAILLTTFLLAQAGPAAAADAPLHCRIKHVETYATTVVDDKAFFITTDGKLGAADIQACDVLWRWQPSDSDASIASRAPQLSLQETGFAWTFAVGDGVVYALDDASAWERKSRLTALDAATGDQLWSQPIEFMATYVFLYDGVLLAQGDEVLAAIDPATGDRLWRLPFLDEGMYEEFVEGMVFVPFYDDNGAEEELQTMQAVDVHTGKVQWSMEFDPGFWFYAEATPADVVLFQGYRSIDEETFEDVTIAVDVATGTELWRKDGLQAVSVENFGDAGFGLTFTDNGGATFRAFEITSGERMWSRPSKLMPYEIAIGEKRIVVAVYDEASGDYDDMSVYALDRRTGDRIWSRKINWGVLGLGIQGNYAYLVEGDYAWALNLETGKKAWTQYIGDYPVGGDAVSVSENAIVITNQSGSLFVFDPNR
jgi:outer membrane protein assembly factor BamB